MDRNLNSSSLTKRWDWIITIMIFKDPFVHEILMLMAKECTSSIPTMGVSVCSTGITLFYNPDFVEQLNDAELFYVITHEIYHVVLHHCTTRIPERFEERLLQNAAADLAVNSLITESTERYMPLHYQGLRAKDFKLEEKLSMEQYMAILSDNNFVVNISDIVSCTKDCRCTDGERCRCRCSNMDCHDFWRESDALKEIVRDLIDTISKNESIWSHMPGDLKEMILAAQRSYIPWVRYLRHYAGNLVGSKHIPTMKRPDRRYGWPYPGKKRQPSERILVAVDTSGSISENDLAQFLSEINALAEIQDIDLVLFDAAIQLGPIPFSRKKCRFEFSGRGGTDFTDVLTLAQNRRYNTVIILTDGFAETPEKPEFVKNILWVITKDGEKPVEWGKEIKIG